LIRRIDVTANVASEHHAGADFDAKLSSLGRFHHQRATGAPKTFLMVVAVVVVVDAGAAAVVVAAHHRHGDRGHASN
jgi:hypothetical protein